MFRLHSCFLLVFGIWILVLPPQVVATYDPLSVPNNRIGVHILAPSELISAAKLVNSSGGDWGYVTIPMQSSDRDPQKWREFFENTNRLHIIPIIRLATYVDGDHWVRPTAYDLIDFANFLNTMPWPTKNRYIIVFNEPNHAKEWGGTVNPGEYAALLVQAKEIFSSRSTDFFIISAGLDMSVPQTATSMDALQFYREMFRLVPNWSRGVDGLGFHAYPNPGFTADVSSRTRFGVRSFDYELSELRRYGFTPKNIFITETGSLSSRPFYTPAFQNIWNDSNLVAVTPFLLFAGAGDFTGFSLLNQQNEPTSKYLEITSLAKSKGSPLLAQTDSSIPELSNSTPEPSVAPAPSRPSLLSWIKSLFNRAAPQLNINGHLITVEIADTDASREHGLSGRPPLPDNYGMLFVFPDSLPRTFWMKDMNFGLDMIWIDRGRIVAISPDIPPPSQTNGQPQVVPSGKSATWVLEVPAGFAAAKGLQVGDSVNLNR